MTVLQSDVEVLLGRSLTAAEAARFTRLAQMAEAILESLLPGFSVAADTATDEAIPYDDPDVMWTANYPITAVTSLEVDGNALDTADYRWNELGRVTLLGGGRLNSWEINLRSFPIAPDITITYDYGLLPADVAAFIAEDIADRLRRQASNPDNVVQESIGSYSVTYERSEGGIELPAALRRWKRTKQVSVPLVRYR